MSKPAELRERDDEQLELLLKETQEQIFRLRLQSSTERLEAPSELLKAKRDVARIKTIQPQRELKAEQAANSGPSPGPTRLDHRSPRTRNRR